ncbi:MAG: protein kinase [Candidatus Latescibacterota bacterium]|nr:MAG: protein kinase [Candidatus Latescibacterota bacterium]
MIGQTVSHYRILEELGGGGMGVVYKAEDTKLKRMVALKFLPPELTRDNDAKTRFIHEAQAASALQHHNICTIHEIDETQDGRLFICMDCYKGETLKDLVGKGPTSIDKALDIVIQVADGLSEAHAAGSVHRDIKPANIIVTRNGVVKILDFGLAKLADMTKVTKTGTAVGTVAYMSPEQAKGEETDHRSDIWSLGVVLYELLAGERPFPGGHDAAVLYGVINRDPEPLSSHRDDLPGQLQRVIDKALKKASSERYDNISVFMADLEELREGFPSRRTVTSRKTARSINAWSTGTRFAAVATAVVVIVIGVVAILNLLRQPHTPSLEDFALAVVDFRNLVHPNDPTTSAEITGLLHVGLVEKNPIRVVSPDLLHDLRRRLFGSTRGPIEDDQILEVARKSGATMHLSGKIRTGAGQYAMWQLVDTRNGESLAAQRVEGDNLVSLVDQILAGVLPVIAQACGLDEPDATPTVSELTTASPEAYRHYIGGILAYEKDRINEAIRELNKAVRLDSSFALALLELSRIHYRARVLDLERARQYADMAWELRAHLGIKHRMVLEAHREHLEHRDVDAMSTYREILARWPDDRETLRNLSELLIWDWRLDEAAVVCKQGFTLYPDELGFGISYERCLSSLGRRQEALEAAQTCVQREPEDLYAWEELGHRYLEMGLQESAEDAFRRAIEIDPEALSSRRSLAWCEYSKGNVSRAIEIYDQISKGSDLLPTGVVAVLTENRFNLSLSLLHAEAGRYEESLEFFEKAGEYLSGPDMEMRVGRDRCILLLRMGRFADVLEWTEPLVTRDEVSPGRIFATSLRAQAFVGLDSLQAARSALREISAIGQQWPGTTRFMVLKITAQLALAGQKPEAALEALNEMRATGVFPGGLVDIEYREMLARAYRMAGRHDEAAQVLEELLWVCGGHAISHAQLGYVYDDLGRPADAIREYTTFLEMWSQADEGLPELEDARARLAALEAGS